MKWAALQMFADAGAQHRPYSRRVGGVRGNLSVEKFMPAGQSQRTGRERAEILLDPADGSLRRTLTSVVVVVDEFAF
jgi:hypothetical protein